MKTLITQSILATLASITVFGAQHDYSYSDFNQSAYHMNLTGANFEGARIGGRRDFAGAKLIDANLQDANFSKVSLAGANLTGANLTGTDFTDARFSTGTKWPEGFDPLTIGAHGPGVDYSDSEFSVTAYHLDLTGANFTRARIGGRRDFVGAKLIDANLQDANFSMVRLQNARLMRANLRGADLRQIQYNANTDWTGAIYSVHTQWPEGFDPQAAGARLESQVPEENPDGEGLIHYKKEYEKAKLLLAELMQQTDSLKNSLLEKDRKILSLSERIDRENEALTSLKTEVANAQTEKDTLINELSEAKEGNLAAGRKVSKLQAELADSMTMEATLRQEVDSERSTLDEKTDEFAQIESMLSIPHLTGWHYTANQGWLFTEPGSYPLVYSDKSQSWTYYDQGTSDPWWYYHFNSESWVDWAME